MNAAVQWPHVSRSVCPHFGKINEHSFVWPKRTVRRNDFVLKGEVCDESAWYKLALGASRQRCFLTFCLKGIAKLKFPAIPRTSVHIPLYDANFRRGGKTSESL